MDERRLFHDVLINVHTCLPLIAQCFVGPLPAPSGIDSSMAAWINSFPFSTASYKERLCARWAVMAAEYVQPVPCVSFVSIRFFVKTCMSFPSYKKSVASLSLLKWPPFTSAAFAPYV